MAFKIQLCIISEDSRIIITEISNGIAAQHSQQPYI